MKEHMNTCGLQFCVISQKKKRIRRASRGEERKKQRKVKEKEIEEILTYMHNLHIYTMWTLVKKGAKKFNVFKIEVV